MKQIKWEDSKFTELIRISKENKKWIKENKGKKSSAGFLDKIIDNYKSSLESNNSEQCQEEKKHQDKNL